MSCDPSVHQKTEKPKYNYSTFLKRKKKIAAHTTAWMKLEDIILSEIGQAQGQTHSGFHLDEVLRSARAQRQEEWQCPGPGEQGNGQGASVKWA